MEISLVNLFVDQGHRLLEERAGRRGGEGEFFWPRWSIPAPYISPRALVWLNGRISGIRIMDSWRDMENLPREKRPGDEVEPLIPSWLADEWLNNSFLFYQLYWSQTIAQTCLEGVDTEGTKGAKDYYEGVNGLESRGVLTSNRLMGMCRWIGSYFPLLDLTIGDTFSLELLELNRTFSVFGGSEKSGRLGFKNGKIFTNVSIHCRIT